MTHKRPPIPVIVLLVLVLIAAGWFGIRALLDSGNDALTASGTIEAVDITISPEMGGKVAEVLVDEGDTVHAGDVLFRLDDTAYQAQRNVAVATLDLATAAASTAKYAQWTAEDNFTLVFNAARLESVSTRTSDWRAPNLPGYTLPGGYFSQNELIVAANAEVDAARSARDVAQGALNDLVLEPANADFVAAETRLINTRASVIVAQDVLTRANLSTNTDVRDAAQTAYDAAKTELDDAQSAYDALKDTDAADAITTARAALSVAEEGYQAAQDRLLALQIGIDSPKVVAAQSVLNQAVAAAEQAQIAIAQAEASLELLDAQIAKLTVHAPADGVILFRSIQPGEVVAVGAKALTLGRLDDLTITVYVPEDRYGELSLGQSAAVTVDSFPGATFTAVIVHISDQAEFTPRNVQTVEGRSSTVYAVRLRVQDPDGRLKPGMPADVTFTR
ncbi:MAG: HlyD family secretion protein [Anaerolineaceae bacterium]|nr:MAG: HlyD family secretion protein [Anaerolineaceae bacterium]